MVASALEMRHQLAVVVGYVPKARARFRRARRVTSNSKGVATILANHRKGNTAFRRDPEKTIAASVGAVAAVARKYDLKNYTFTPCAVY